MTKVPDFAPLQEWEFDALKADIEHRGVLVPIEFDADTGEVVDGRNRLRACEELGITDYPRSEHSYKSDEERKLVTIILNTYRRQLAPIKHRAYVDLSNQLRLDLGYPDEPIVVPSRAKKASASDQPDALAARQRQHRLRERMRPDTPLPANANVWLVADEILDCLDRIRPYLVRLHAPLEDLEQAGELLKGLMWMGGGPESPEAS